MENSWLFVQCELRNKIPHFWLSKEVLFPMWDHKPKKKKKKVSRIHQVSVKKGRGKWREAVY